jgi:hypothetical protein
MPLLNGSDDKVPAAVYVTPVAYVVGLPPDGVPFTLVATFQITSPIPKSGNHGGWLFESLAKRFGACMERIIMRGLLQHPQAFQAVAVIVQSVLELPTASKESFLGFPVG